MLNSGFLTRLARSAPWAIAVITTAALLAGIYGRFKGLGTWPLGVDEFYISRSIDNVLRTGLPQFPCGGYYTRGVLYQYAVALLRMCGMSAEFSGRIVPAISSLAVLPAVYLLGRRVHGRTVGLLVMILLLVSIWEIEMARFARMYAPFQAVFAWYLVFFLRYTVDRHRRSLVLMVLFSVLGILTWEGGVFIGLLNMLPPLINQKNGRLRRADWFYLAGMLVLLLLLVLATRDLRGFATPPLQSASDDSEAQGGALAFSRFIVSVHEGWLWFALSLAPLGFLLASLRWVWALRHRWLAASGLAVSLLCATFHQFLAAGATLILLPLLGLVDWRELTARTARFFWLAITANAVFWLSFCLLTGVWDADVSAASTTQNKIMAVAKYLLGLPNILDEIVRPWGRVLPLLGIGLVIAIASLIVRTIVRRERDTVTSVLLVAMVIMVLGVGAITTDRVETRYTFFLYPLALMLAMTALALWCEKWIRERRTGLFLTGIAGLTLFALSEDFQPRHLADIDSARITFRLGMPPAVADHYYERGDTRGAALWLDAHVHQDDVVLNGIPSIDQYYHGVTFFFLDAGDPHYETYACRSGTEDRWTQHRLLYTMDAVRPKISATHIVFLIGYPGQTKTVLAEAKMRGWSAQLVWSSIDKGIDVLALNQ
jgi:hypothetical protein